MNRADKSLSQIDSLEVQGEFERAPADFAYWSAQHAKATRDFLLAKHNRETIYSRLLLEIRETNNKLTVNALEANVIIQTEYQNAKLAEIEAEAEKVKLAGTVEALRVRKDMLIQIGAHVRAEMERDPQIREMHRGRREIKGE